MNLDELIDAAEALRGSDGGQAPVVVEVNRPPLIGGALPLVRALQGETLAQLQPGLFARTDSTRFVSPTIAIKA